MKLAEWGRGGGGGGLRNRKFGEGKLEEGVEFGEGKEIG